MGAIQDKQLPPQETDILRPVIKNCPKALNNKIITHFFGNPKHVELYVQYLKHPSEHTRAELAKSFRAFFFSVRFTSYLSSLIRYGSIDFHRAYRKRIKRNPLIFDTLLQEDSSLTLGEFLLNERKDPSPQKTKDVAHFQSMISNPELFYAFQALTEKQKNIITRSYGMEQSDTEIASSMSISQQAVTKTRHAALTKLRRQLQTTTTGKER